MWEKDIGGLDTCFFLCVCELFFSVSTFLPLNVFFCSIPILERIILQRPIFFQGFSLLFLGTVIFPDIQQ